MGEVSTEIEFLDNSESRLEEGAEVVADTCLSDDALYLLQEEAGVRTSHEAECNAFAKLWRGPSGDLLIENLLESSGVVVAGKRLSAGERSTLVHPTEKISKFRINIYHMVSSEKRHISDREILIQKFYGRVERVRADLSSPEPAVERVLRGGDVPVGEPSQKGSTDMDEKKNSKPRIASAEKLPAPLHPALALALAPSSEDILCPHPSEDDLEAMLRDEKSGQTDKRLLRARWCEGCRLMLALIDPHGAR